VDALRFLTDGTGRTLAQAAIRWILAEPCFACVLPNIYDEEQLQEFAAASDVPDLSPDEVRRVNELYARNFDLEPATV
jgi:aryl-alcohol dehydrogenase-like predicted oxidoreductase